MMELRQIIARSREKILFDGTSYKQFCDRERKLVSIVYMIVIFLQLSFFKQIQQVSLIELNIKTSRIRKPATVDSTKAIEELSPFHNLQPDAYLDPVSFTIHLQLSAAFCDTAGLLIEILSFIPFL